MADMTSAQAAVIAGAVAAALASLTIATTGQAQAASMEKCYGVALRGQNDCAGGNHECAGRSLTDYDPGSFKWVPKGTCAELKAALRRKGS